MVWFRHNRIGQYVYDLYNYIWRKAKPPQNGFWRRIYVLSTLDSYVKQKCINFINGLTHTISSFAVIYLVNHRVTFGCRMWKQAPWDKICRAKCILRLPKRNFFSSNSIHMPHCHHLVSYANHNSFIYCQKAIQIAS